jgi:hypothetical protein
VGGFGRRRRPGRTGAVDLAGADHESTGAAINDRGQMVGPYDNRAAFLTVDG